MPRDIIITATTITITITPKPDLVPKQLHRRDQAALACSILTKRPSMEGQWQNPCTKAW
jgi:hypothetical protein